MLEEIIPIEVFAAKDGAGVFIAAPLRCGLKNADTLRVSGLSMVAIKNESILPIDLPDLEERERRYLLKFADTGRPLSVGEFLASGLADSYLLRLRIE
jgi:hypothetical protein